MAIITSEKIAKLIESCDFLSPDLVKKWQQNLSKIPEVFYPMIWKTFEESKHEVDYLYAQFELNRDENNEYSRQINEKSSQAVMLVKSLKLKEASGLIGL